jgi:hypothetical protein
MIQYQVSSTMKKLLDKGVEEEIGKESETQETLAYLVPFNSHMALFLVLKQKNGKQLRVKTLTVMINGLFTMGLSNHYKRDFLTMVLHLNAFCLHSLLFKHLIFGLLTLKTF